MRECLLLLSLRTAESLSSCLLSKNVKTKLRRNIVLLFIWHECEIWSLTLREEHRLKVSLNKVLRKILGYWIYRLLEKSYALSYGYVNNMPWN